METFHLIVFSVISFSNILQCPMYNSFISLFNFVPKYFFFFDSIVTPIIFFLKTEHDYILEYNICTTAPLKKKPPPKQITMIK